MDKQLPSRPHLDHLRRQAKVLLAALESGDAEAVATIQKHLPAARGMTTEQVRATRFRLADAQSAVARKTGFGSWPQLARHVDQLRSLEGTWEFASLSIDGSAMPASALGSSRVLIDGDRFRTESPEATYEGVFNIDVEAEPHQIDIEFIAGPEAGNWNFGVFRLDGDQLEICLDMNGKPRPGKFATSAGSGHAYERLTRVSAARPEQVNGGVAPTPSASAAVADTSAFEYVASPTLTRLQGDWKAVQIVREGQAFPKMMLATGARSARQNEVKITFAGQLIIHALVRIAEDAIPMQIDYYNLGGAAKGAVQLGIMKWVGEEACFCMASPGGPRPTAFESHAGDGQTLSQWAKKK
jgi:uncharacterized protein (TIGR03067 family)